MSGYIKLYRKILDNPLFESNPQARHLFQDLLLQVTWKPTRQDWRGHPVDLEPGSVMISQRRLAEMTGFSHQQVRTLLVHLTNHQIVKINTVGNTGPMVLSICNWIEYQDQQHSHQHSSNTAPTQRQHTKEEREEEEENNNNTRVRAREAMPIDPSDPFGLRDPACSEGVIIGSDGSVTLINGTRQRWLETFGNDARRLDLALIQIAGNLQTNSRQPIKAQVERLLAQQAANRIDGDRRYREAQERRDEAKKPPKVTMANLGRYMAQREREGWR
jgi:hypothetical protein